MTRIFRDTIPTLPHRLDETVVQRVRQHMGADYPDDDHDAHNQHMASPVISGLVWALGLTGAAAVAAWVAWEVWRVAQLIATGAGA
jgi:hypothetical protein